MAVISTSTFNALNRRVSVRLQQGVPIVDADWNEMDDIRRFEMQAFVKWFVGDGVPNGNDGFRVAAIVPPLPPPPPPPPVPGSDFQILAGITGAPDGLANVGRLLVNGMDVMISKDTTFAAQPLHASHGAAADAEAARLGVPKIGILTFAASGLVVAYLDVWERLLTPTEEPNLVLPGLGTESCARITREWAVRTRAGVTAPAPGEPEFINGHSYYALATIARRAGDHNINPSDITDLREQSLALPPATLITDLLGIAPADYRRGLGRPVVSLRAAINAVLRGDLPSTDPAFVSGGPPANVASSAVFEDASGNLWVFFTSNRGGNQNIFLRRFLAGTQTWGPDEPITTDPAGDAEPVGLVDSTGDVWIFWNSNRGGAGQNLWMKRFRAGTAAWDPDANLTTSAGDNFQQIVLEDNNANLWVFWMSLRSGNKPSLWLKRYQRATNTWTADAATPLISSPAPAMDQFPAAAVDAGGTVFLLWQSNRNAATDHIFWNRMNSAGAFIGADQQVVPAAATAERDPFVLVDSRDQVWAFWRTQVGGFFQIQAARFDRNTNVWTLEPNLTTGTFNNFKPMAVEDDLGNVWAMWRSVRGGGQEVLAYRIYNRPTATWSVERPMTPNPGDHKLAGAVSTAAGAIVALWTSTSAGTAQAVYRQFFPTI